VREANDHITFDGQFEDMAVMHSVESTQPTEEEIAKLRNDKQEAGKGGVKRGKVWGPVIPQRRSQRNLGDDKTMLEKAQDLKRKHDLEDNKGIKQISSSSLLSVATEIGLSFEEGNPQTISMLDNMIALEVSRNNTVIDKCQHDGCSNSSSSVEVLFKGGGQGGIPGTPEKQYPRSEDSEEVEEGWTKVGKKKKNRKKK
jgi:hypothetical protein